MEIDKKGCQIEQKTGGKNMDERLKEVYRRIYTELLFIILMANVVSLIVKFAVLRMEWSSCITEFLILVGSPVYLLIRQNMLGAWTDQEIRPVKRRMIWACIGSMIGYTGVSFAIKRTFNWLDIMNLLVFVVVFFLVYRFTKKINHYFYTRKMKEYEEDDN